MQPEQLQEMKNAIEQNQNDSPALSIDPATNKMSVVGNPNNIHPTKGEYKIEYEYQPYEVAEEDKSMFKHIVDESKNIDKYVTTVTYENRRVKPLYRNQVVTILLGILGDVGVLQERGYSAEELTEKSGEVFIKHTEDMLELARIVLDEDRERLEHAPQLITFLTQLLENEPNLVNETSNFLASLNTDSSMKAE